MLQGDARHHPLLLEVGALLLHPLSPRRRRPKLPVSLLKIVGWSKQAAAAIQKGDVEDGLACLTGVHGVWENKGPWMLKSQVDEPLAMAGEGQEAAVLVQQRLKAYQKATRMVLQQRCNVVSFQPMVICANLQKEVVRRSWQMLPVPLKG